MADEYGLRFQNNLRLEHEYPLGPDSHTYLLAGTTPDVIESTCCQTNWQPRTLHPDVEEASREFSQNVKEPPVGGRFTRNVLLIAEMLSYSPALFSAICSSPDKMAALPAISLYAAKFLARVKAGAELRVICPSIYEGSLMKKFRIITNEAHNMEWRSRESLYVVIKDWEQFSHELTDKEKVNYLVQLSGQGYGAQALAISLGYFSGFHYKQLLELAGEDVKAGKFLVEIFPRDEKGDPYKKTMLAVDKFKEKYSDHMLMTQVKYQVPVVYAMDLGSVLFEITKHLPDDDYKEGLIKEMYHRYGDLLYYRPFDTSTFELARVSLKENIFKNGQTAAKAVDNMIGFTKSKALVARRIVVKHMVLESVA